jgi:hypothetical protein
VLKELKRIDDDLYKWAKQREHMFMQPIESVQIIMQGIMAKYPRLVDSNKHRSMADPWVIAQAQYSSAIVITEEKAVYGKSPKIPDVCEAMKIKYADTLTLLRAMKLKF